MYVFWWSGRGYVTVLVILATLTAFGLAATAGVPDGVALWATALLTAAAINWLVGTKINHKKLTALKPRSMSGRLFYRANHRFMSLPMETFSLILVAAAVGIFVYQI